MTKTVPGVRQNSVHGNMLTGILGNLPMTVAKLPSSDSSSFPFASSCYMKTCTSTSKLLTGVSQTLAQ